MAREPDRLGHGLGFSLRPTARQRSAAGLRWAAFTPTLRRGAEGQWYFRQLLKLPPSVTRGPGVQQGYYRVAELIFWPPNPQGKAVACYVSAFAAGDLKPWANLDDANLVLMTLVRPRSIRFALLRSKPASFCSLPLKEWRVSRSLGRRGSGTMLKT